MADTRNFYAIETQAHRDDYEMEDVTRKTLKGDTFWKMEFGSPGVLTTGINADHVIKKWKQSLPVCSYQLAFVSRYKLTSD
jgi:hypothetical protein